MGFGSKQFTPNRSGRNVNKTSFLAIEFKMSTIEDRVVRCDTCDKTFEGENAKTNLRRHKRYENKIKNAKKYKCDICDVEIINTSSSIAKHKKIHDKVSVSELQVTAP